MRAASAGAEFVKLRFDIPLFHAGNVRGTDLGISLRCLPVARHARFKHFFAARRAVRAGSQLAPETPIVSHTTSNIQPAFVVRATLNLAFGSRIFVCKNADISSRALERQDVKRVSAARLRNRSKRNRQTFYFATYSVLFAVISITLHRDFDHRPSWRNSESRVFGRIIGGFDISVNNGASRKPPICGISLTTGFDLPAATNRVGF